MYPLSNVFEVILLYKRYPIVAIKNIAKIIESGRKVAVCDQVEDPKKSKGIVKREVVRIVTPGSVVDDSDVDSKTNLYLAAIAGNNGVYGLAHMDLSTGEFRLTEVNKWRELLDELGRIAPADKLRLSFHPSPIDSRYRSEPACPEAARAVDS